MLAIGDTIVSLDVLTQEFLCNINHCKGICCVEGDSGAPITKEEAEIIENLLSELKPYLTKEALDVIDRQGVAYTDIEGEFVISIVNDKECVFTYKENGIWKCAIERLYTEGKINFKKPISCHLYPIRLKQYRKFMAVEYHKWEVCSHACVEGKRIKLPVYKFLKEPLIRRFGEAWYAELELTAKEYLKSDYAKNKANK
ncbi:MAG: DUF3109 family protein [Bacteroidia bacterium]|nr:DUF3109 family protein [Bacteroidia bacterium]